MVGVKVTLNKPLLLLYDADMLIYQACSSCETPINWGNDLWTLHVYLNEAIAKVDDMVAQYSDIVLNHLGYEGDFENIMCLTDPTDNFRKKVLSSYKLNRVSKRKPLSYPKVAEWCMSNYKSYKKPSLEADDCLGILSTKNPGHSIIISADKDFKTVPGMFYNFMQDEFMNITEQEADYWHLYQTLVGDVTDNYKGCPKVGAVTAKKLLDKECSWDTVVGAYEKQGLTESDALVQARVARILRATDYDFKSHKPILWRPKHD